MVLDLKTREGVACSFSAQMASLKLKIVVNLKGIRPPKEIPLLS
jgi:hypothetical protein